MKITDLKELPVRVKLNENFKLEDSLDSNMIIQINNYFVESDDCGIIVEKNTLPNNTIDFKIKLDDGRLLRKRHNHLNIVNN